MAQFTESLCEEVIRTEGRCGLTRNEITQMARFALRAIRNEGSELLDATRFRWLRRNSLGATPPISVSYKVGDTYERVTEMEELGSVIDAAIAKDSGL